MAPSRLAEKLSPLDMLVGILYWQLTLCGAELVVETLDPPAIYNVFCEVMPLWAWGGMFLGAAQYLLFSYLHQRAEQNRRPITVKHGRLHPLNPHLFLGGVAAGVCFISLAVAYFVHFDFSWTTAQGMYLPAAVGSFFVATEGAPPTPLPAAIKKILRRRV